jgi:drug/metabolite transporter (DMT)-like permease
MNEEQNNLMLPEGKEDVRRARREERFRRREERRAYWQARHGHGHLGRLLIGILVLFFGLTLLLKALGYFPQGINFDFSQFWPLLIVAFGLSLLDTRRQSYLVFGYIIILLVVVLLALSLRNANDAAPGSSLMRVHHGPQMQDNYMPGIPDSI